MLKSLRMKFVGIFMTLVLVMMGAIFILLYSVTKENLQNDNVQAMLNVSKMHLDENHANKDMFRSLPCFVIEVDKQGKILFIEEGNYDLDDEQFVKEILEAAHYMDPVTENEELGTLSQYNLRYCKTRIEKGTRIVYAFTLAEQLMLRNLLRSCAWSGLIGFVVFLLVSMLLADWAVEPVEKAWQRQKRFVADASHELKTPITVIMANAELLKSSDSQEDTKQFSSNIYQVSTQMRTLVEDMLELARLENVGVGEIKQAVDFSLMAEEAILPFEPVFFEKGLQFSSQIEPEILVTGNEYYLKQIFTILLDNAGKYTNPNGRIHLLLKKLNYNKCILLVENDGPEMTPDEMKNIFKRFYQVDKARTGTHSFGLGLSIAKNIVDFHKGKIHAERKGEMNQFIVELPMTSHT